MQLKAPASASVATATRETPAGSPVTKEHIHVALFCGGRGSASLISEFMRWPQIRLSLIVNAYDDGLSTGELRDLVPNMLGPSDFRKNLSRLLNLYSNEQYNLQRLLEQRFPKDFSQINVEAFETFVMQPERSKWLPAPFGQLLQQLEPGQKRIILQYLRTFLKHRHESGRELNYPDCSFGNLVFAGAYLESKGDFNATVKCLADLFGSRADLINVSRGENRTLVALKADGVVLARESEVVGPQSASPILDVFLLDRPLDETVKRKLEVASFEERRKLLAALDTEVALSPEAENAVRNANLIVYGPGTQFSSLLPSYRTRGLPEAIRESRAALKVFVANLDADHDIQGLAVSDLVDKALELMGDEGGDQGLITHIFCNPASESRQQGLKLGRIAGDSYKSANVVRGDFESPIKRGTHSGYAVVSRAIDLYENALQKSGLSSIEIFIDLMDRSRAIESVLQEFLDLPWLEQFERVQLRVNRMQPVDMKLPSYATLISSDYGGVFTEVEALMNWLAQGNSDYLVTLTGDGEYRLRDIFIGIQVLRAGVFGAAYGSRVQSRNQFRSALDSAYGERRLVRSLSWCGAFLFTFVFALLFRVIFSDPFTGFRIYRRSRLTGKFMQDLLNRNVMPAARVTRLLLRHEIEIAEIPVTYRTFRGFTKPGWRILRGLRNLFGVLH